MHFKDITGDSYRTLQPGDEVVFTGIQSAKGLQAVAVEQAKSASSDGSLR